jgi:hypothetical protein
MVDNVVKEQWRDRLHNIEQLAELAGGASGASGGNSLRR